MKILIIKPSGIGDIVHSLPLAIGIKYLYPSCELHWVVFNKFAEVLSNINYIDKVILWERQAGVKEYINLIKKLKRENYDVIIDLQVLFRTALLGFLIKNKKVISTSYVRELTHLFVKPVGKFDPNLHAVDRNYQVINFFVEDKHKDVPQPIQFLPWITLSEVDKKNVERILCMNNNTSAYYIVFAISSRGEHKIWPWDNFFQLIKLLKVKYPSFVPVFVGSKDDENRVQPLVSKLEIEGIEYKNFVGKLTLIQTEVVIENSVLTISNDNGIAHISAAMNKPTLILFGPSNPKWFYPYNNLSGYIYKSLECSPCGIKTSCKDNKCMKQITPIEVFEYICRKFSQYLR